MNLMKTCMNSSHIKLYLNMCANFLYGMDVYT